VLVLGTDQRVILAVTRSLGRQALIVDLAWCPADSMAAHSRYASRVHEISPYSPHDGRWKQELLGLLQRETYDLVIPCNDSTLVPLVAHRTDFAGFPQIHLPPDEVFAVVSDKFRTFQLAQSLGVNVPRGRVVDGSANPRELIQAFGLPLVLKPQATVTVETEGMANVVRKVHACSELEIALQEHGARQVLAQENFVGRGVGIEMLVHEGDVLVAFQHARIHETVEWGSSYRKSVPVMPQLLEAAQRLMKALGYTGVAMAEFILNPDTGRWVFLEINGRFWGSLPLAVAAGADFPYYLYQMVVEGRRQFSREYRLGVRCRNLLLDIGWMRKRYAVSGWRKLATPFRAAGQLAMIALCRDHLDSFSFDDPRPQFSELRGLAEKASAKLMRKFIRERVEVHTQERIGRRAVGKASSPAPG
jgi:predicted ATP-grasp superfamily ATP-dependent carboligase